MKKMKQYPFDAIRKKRLSLTVLNQTNERVPSKQKFFKWIFETMSQQYSYAEIGLLLCNPEEASYYNQYYRSKNYATNVLSFPLDSNNNNHLCGDLIICPDVVKKEAQQQDKIEESHYAHLVVHGILHLMGYDHLEEQEALEMELKEIKILHFMGYKNPY